MLSTHVFLEGCVTLQPHWMLCVSGVLCEAEGARAGPKDVGVYRNVPFLFCHRVFLFMLLIKESNPH